jgi:four helix bundle protein
MYRAIPLSAQAWLETRILPANDLKTRSRAFASLIVELVDSLPTSRCADILGRQLLRSATSVGANYRAACRARSHSEFIAKMGIVEEETDESMYWLELLSEQGYIHPDPAKKILDEAGEILRMVVASIKTARENRKK